MSLRPDDRSSRTRDRSSTRDRDRSRSNVRAASPPSAVGYDRGMPGAFSESTYEVRTPEGTARYQEYRPAKGGAPYPPEDRFDSRYEQPSYREGRYERREERDGPRRDDRDRRQDSDDDEQLVYGASRYPSRQYSDSIVKTNPREDDYRRSDIKTYNTTSFAPDGIRYAQPPDHISYTAKSYAHEDDRPAAHRQSSVTYERERTSEVRPDARRQSSIQYESRTETRPERRGTYDQDTRIVEIRPEGRDRKTSEVDIRRVTRTTSNSLVPAGLEPRMNRLSVSGGRPDMLAIAGAGHGGGLPPPSPLLEAYHGTYQSISPMPTAMRLDDDDLDDLPSLDYSKHSKHVDKEKKKVKLYDPEADARALAKALNSSTANAGVICDILPPLSDDQIWELRKEYKKQVKIQGKGINLSKHLKMKLSGNFGKVVYVTALGRWESEGYWANFFYQSHGSRRELLIESLMGRTNAEIRSIKDEFKDKRYNDDLIRCMEKELKMDKFRTAILMSLEGRRQEEQDIYPQEYIDRDTDVLLQAMNSSGGESAMLQIIVRRSDAHLRQVLRQYEQMTGENFARIALKKSNNLVGEVVAHILNGVINKPARDALLLRHAVKDIANHNKDDELRYELLISRLVRLHWDRLHMMRVKKEYKDKYGKYLEDDLEDSTKGDFRDFVCELCDVQGPGTR